MANRGRASYQYETSPRKIEPVYKPQKSKTKSQPNNDKIKVKKTNLQAKKEQELKSKKTKAKTVMYTLLIFTAFFVITYRNSQIDESFMQVKKMQEELALLQKENEQLKVSIENSFNLSTVEQEAKELLGMQKLDDSQKEYITLPKKEFVEPVTEKIDMEEETWYEKIIRIITNLW